MGINMRDSLIAMAKEWQCDKNQMVCGLIEQYGSQYKLVTRLLDELNCDDTTYVEEKNDRYHGIGYTINPLLKEIPKITESANKTANLIMNTIQTVGIRPESKTVSVLSKFLSEDDDEETETEDSSQCDDEDGKEEKEE